MKKFYFLILSGIFMLACLVPQAQIYNSITNNPTNLTFDNPAFWGGIAPPNPCNGCTITINADVTILPADQRVFNGGSLTVTNNATVTINTYVQFFNSYIQVGAGSSFYGIVNLNDQADLNGTSVVRLANVNSWISTANLDGHDPIIGPNVDYGHTSTSPGLFYVLSSPINGYSFSVVLSSLYIGTNPPPPGPGGDPGGEYSGSLYSFNCDDGGPNDCIPGVVYGPAMTSVDPVYGAIFGPAPTLPVSLVQFLAVKNPDASIKLLWSTAQEVNAGSFNVDRRGDQTAWETIGSVTAKGNSSITSNYNYTDNTPLTGNNYYRLKMIDLDGKFEYSKTVSVSAGGSGLPLVVYSNPFTDQIRLKVNVGKAEALNLTVTDIIGKTYLKRSYHAQAGDNLINLSPAGAASGIYILHIQGSTYEQTVKLVKQ